MNFYSVVVDTFQKGLELNFHSSYVHDNLRNMSYFIHFVIFWGINKRCRFREHRIVLNHVLRYLWADIINAFVSHALVWSLRCSHIRQMGSSKLSALTIFFVHFINPGQSSVHIGILCIIFQLIRWLYRLKDILEVVFRVMNRTFLILSFLFKTCKIRNILILTCCLHKWVVFVGFIYHSLESRLLQQF